MQTVYEAAGGRDGMLRLAHAWHKRVLEDKVVSHAFSHGYHPEHTERLAAYWAEALGGPTTYSDRYGDETSVVRIHSGNGLHEEMDQRANRLFRSGARRCWRGPRRAAPTRAARLLRVGYHDHDGSLPPLGRGCAGRSAHPEVVLGRTRRLAGRDRVTF
jgi:truncated hemoglobin YjbI